MIRICAGLFLLAASKLLFASESVPDEGFVYVSLSTPSPGRTANVVEFDTVIFNSDLGDLLMQQGDAVIGFDFIPDDSGWLKISSPIFSFSYQKRWQSPPKQWEKYDERCSFLGAADFSLIGKNLSAEVIECIDKIGQKSIVYYSRPQGVIAFERKKKLGEASGEIYILESVVGLGAIKTSAEAK